MVSTSGRPKLGPPSARASIACTTRLWIDSSSWSIQASTSSTTYTSHSGVRTQESIAIAKLLEQRFEEWCQAAVETALPADLLSVARFLADSVSAWWGHSADPLEATGGGPVARAAAERGITVRAKASST